MRGFYVKFYYLKKMKIEKEFSCRECYFVHLLSKSVQSFNTIIHCRPAVRISGFHPGDPGSIPGNGTFLPNKIFFIDEKKNVEDLKYGIFQQDPLRFFW